MFCNNCGKEMADNLNFCTSCGANVGNREPNVAHSQPYVPQQPMYQQSYSPPVNRKKQSQALGAVFAVLTVITMLLSWFSVKVPTSNLDEFSDFGLDIDDFKVAATSLQIASAVGQASNILTTAEREMKRYTGAFYDKSELRQVRDVIRSVKLASAAINTVKIMVILSTISFLAFIYMMLVENRNGAMLGQLGSIIAFLASLIFIISMLVTNFSIKNMLQNLDTMFDVSRMVSFSATVWAYLTAVISIITLFFITARKSILKGE